MGLPWRPHDLPLAHDLQEKGARRITNDGAVQPSEHSLSILLSESSPRRRSVASQDADSRQSYRSTTPGNITIPEFRETSRSCRPGHHSFERKPRRKLQPDKHDTKMQRIPTAEHRRTVKRRQTRGKRRQQKVGAGRELMGRFASPLIDVKGHGKQICLLPTGRTGSD